MYLQNQQLPAGVIAYRRSQVQTVFTCRYDPSCGKTRIHSVLFFSNDKYITAEVKQSILLFLKKCPDTTKINPVNFLLEVIASVG